ncbi:MAG: Hsp70 family protein [Planctomycetota bacterium]|nr:Hsp70 family protein [Planctomycetota bacterium]
MPAVPEFDPLVDEAPSRFIVGIDLGTTNMAVTYVDTEDPEAKVTVFPVLQVVAPGETEARETLPSFHFQPPQSEAAAESMRLPWHRKPNRYCVGVMARDESARTAGRAVVSAKSWLCHAGVDRTAALLPWQGAPDVERLSPVDASARYLEHIRRAWNHSFPGAPLEKQDIVLTLPASFDEVARTLTIEAAQAARLPRITLLEEPQAAFYAWVNQNAGNWAEQVEVGQKILVCDIGGGTTDFTLIRVRASEVEGERVQFHRVAVGQHLILGGDNLDLALAKFLEQKLAGGSQLPSQQWDRLVGRARQIKEDFLSPQGPETLTVQLPAMGSRLIGGGLQTEVTRDEVQSLLVEGFLPRVELDSRPMTHATGFQEFGLPYTSDPAITKHLATFLYAHRDTDLPASDPLSARPDILLFNGGFFGSDLMKTRIIDQLRHWFQTGDDPGWSPRILENDRLDLAVARGAACFGRVRRGEGVRIAASLARSYYIAVDALDERGAESKALCIVPGRAEPGQEFELHEREFSLTLSQPVEFSLLVSSVRLADEAGELHEVDPDQMTPLPPIRTVIQATSRNEKRDIPVKLHVSLSEIGTVELSCREVGSDRSWKLQFDIRSAVRTDLSAHQGDGEQEGFVAEENWDHCCREMKDVFTADGSAKPVELMARLTECLAMERNEWPMSLLRRMWESLLELAEGRKKSAAHEARWINLLGYALRPGYGFAVDDWRVSETWRHVRDQLQFDSPAGRAGLHILWRRLAGGLSRGQQIAMADPLFSALRALTKKLSGGKVKAATIRPEDTTEIWRLLGSFELLHVDRKIELAKMIFSIREKKSMNRVQDGLVWTLGRLGQRTPLYGPLNTVVPVAEVESWIETILDWGQPDRNSLFAVVQMARRTGDRYRDIGEVLRSAVLQWLEENRASAAQQELVREIGELDEESSNRAFGESLPRGLRLSQVDWG